MATETKTEQPSSSSAAAPEPKGGEGDTVATTTTTNAEGASSSTAPPAVDQATMDQLTEAEKTLQDLVTKKKIIDKQLATVEASIYALEESYLTDTQQYGNVVRGFDGYLQGRTDKKKYKINEADRLFSQSSVTYHRALEIKAREEEYSREEEEMYTHRKKKQRRDD
ncbi:hypothetical protein SmJEL517_g03739 [Synchytrium microbalum]|uniref:Chromatin modification-related protein EAF6 n=1 Tax=Synchytrium microbalum TaxID=1806994 RepID=A0A507C745_9FUNG|nr:uncharacterized protein SmJEL517_g03739 [Synchytrium microbalum]TPX33305.1 hypothetical protein SmJEL517_g03739 [Synchytrium microbalum]